MALESRIRELNVRQQIARTRHRRRSQPPHRRHLPTDHPETTEAATQRGTRNPEDPRALKTFPSPLAGEGGPKGRMKGFPPDASDFSGRRADRLARTPRSFSFADTFSRKGRRTVREHHASPWTSSRGVSDSPAGSAAARLASSFVFLSAAFFTRASSSSWPMRPSDTGSTGLMLAAFQWVRLRTCSMVALVVPSVLEIRVSEISGMVADEPGDGVGTILAA